MRPYQELIYVQNCLESVDLLPHLFSRYPCSRHTFSCACDRLRFSFQDIFVLHLSFTRLCQGEGAQAVHATCRRTAWTPVTDGYGRRSTRTVHATHTRTEAKAIEVDTGTWGWTIKCQQLLIHRGRFSARRWSCRFLQPDHKQYQASRSARAQSS